jgi:hypothetical protein
MDDFVCYEFGVQIWFEDGIWHWGIAQEWEHLNSREVEGLSYGTAETLEMAAVAVAEEMKQIKFESV